MHSAFCSEDATPESFLGVTCLGVFTRLRSDVLGLCFGPLTARLISRRLMWPRLFRSR